MGVIRGLWDLLADLDTRSRLEPANRNKVINKAVLVSEIVYFSSETVTSTIDASQPKAWAGGSAGSTGFELVFSFGEWQ